MKKWQLWALFTALYTGILAFLRWLGPVTCLVVSTQAATLVCSNYGTADGIYRVQLRVLDPRGGFDLPAIKFSIPAKQTYFLQVPDYVPKGTPRSGTSPLTQDCGLQIELAISYDAESTWVGEDYWYPTGTSVGRPAYVAGMYNNIHINYNRFGTSGMGVYASPPVAGGDTDNMPALLMSLCAGIWFSQLLLKPLHA